jgi:hypothetical protein
MIQSINDVCQGFPDAEFLETNSIIIGNGTTATQPCIATTSAAGNTALLMTASNGTVSATSAAYYINQTSPAAPEPATILLFGSGLCAVASRRRKFRTGKK